jgi:hypothetical protein
LIIQMADQHEERYQDLSDERVSSRRSETLQINGRCSRMGQWRTLRLSGATTTKSRAFNEFWRSLDGGGALCAIDRTRPTK